MDRDDPFKPARDEVFRDLAHIREAATKGADMTTPDTIQSMMKAAAWEEAKGKLRGFVSMLGAIYDPSPYQTEQWEKAGKAAEEFIKSFEDEALHE